MIHRSGLVAWTSAGPGKKEAACLRTSPGPDAPLEGPELIVWEDVWAEALEPLKQVLGRSLGRFLQP